MKRQKALVKRMTRTVMTVPPVRQALVTNILKGLIVLSEKYQRLQQFRDAWELWWFSILRKEGNRMC